MSSRLYCLIIFLLFAIVFFYSPPHALAASPIGFIDAVTQDSANTITVSGWAQDPDNLNLPIRVHVYIEGVGLGALTADMASSDVGNHRYGQTFTVPPAYIDGKRHLIYAYGIDNNGDATSVLTPQSGFPFQMTIANQPATLDLTDLNLSTIQSITVKTTYDKAHAIGIVPSNYEYSAHLIKQSSPPYYQMIYGGRCYFGSNRQCQTRDSSGNWPQPNGGGDGDHLKYAESNDGINWNAQDYIPVIYQGKEEGNPFLPEWQNRMDPTIIKWGNLYYMYYQLQIDPADGCTAATCDSLSDSITYATSSDLKTWTKSNRLIILNKSKTEPVVHPKAIKVGNEIWLYLSWYDASGWRGMYLIKSTDPTNFDFNQKIANTGDWGYTDGSQHLVLFPNDPANQLHLAIGYQDGTNNNTIPVFVFSHDGLHWVRKLGGFPAALNNLSNIFCNIATDENSSLTPNSPGGNNFSSVYSCATFNGAHSNAGFSDLSSGGFGFTINYKTAAALPGDLTGDGKVDILDYNLLVSKFNNPYTIFDYNTLVANYGK